MCFFVYGSKNSRYLEKKLFSKQLNLNCLSFYYTVKEFVGCT